MSQESPAQADPPAAPGGSSAAPPRREHLATLDGLRGLAVLLVVWHHLPDDVFGSLVETAKFVVRPG